jgi:hypothetical protein
MFGGSCHSFYLFWLFHTFIITFIHKYIHSYPFAETSLLFFIACFAQRETLPWGAEPGFELGPAIQQASALPTEPRCTLVEYSLEIMYYYQFYFSRIFVLVFFSHPAGIGLPVFADRDRAKYNEGGHCGCFLLIAIIFTGKPVPSARKEERRRERGKTVHILAEEGGGGREVTQSK